MYVIVQNIVQWNITIHFNSCDKPKLNCFMTNILQRMLLNHNYKSYNSFWLHQTIEYILSFVMFPDLSWLTAINTQDSPLNQPTHLNKLSVAVSLLHCNLITVVYPILIHIRYIYIIYAYYTLKLSQRKFPEVISYYCC